MYSWNDKKGWPSIAYHGVIARVKMEFVMLLTPTNCEFPTNMATVLLLLSYYLMNSNLISYTELIRKLKWWVDEGGM